MQIKEIVNQHRRDFTAIYVCEHCDHETTGRGYDDDNFHQNVIPKKTCPRCKKSASDTYTPRATKYAAHEVV